MIGNETSLPSSNSGDLFIFTRSHMEHFFPSICMSPKFALAATALALFLSACAFSQNEYFTEPVATDSLKTLLITVGETDQALRKEFAETLKKYKPDAPEMKTIWKYQSTIDAENQKLVAEFLEKYGWPKISDYGDEPSQVVFLVIQHADLTYQKRYFELARTAAESGDLEKSAFALLQDRVLINEGKKQIYGSQVNIDRMGKPSFYPIEDEENVDKRRAEVGLEPLAEYGKRFGIE